MLPQVREHRRQEEEQFPRRQVWREVGGQDLCWGGTRYSRGENPLIHLHCQMRT